MLVGLHVPTNLQMYRQIFKRTDKTPKKHYGGGGGGQLPPPPVYSSIPVSEVTPDKIFLQAENKTRNKLIA